MLIRFVASNFLSFNEEKELNMIASSGRTHKHHVYAISKLNILKGAAIYGANGAGKSNLVKGIDFLQGLVKNGKLNQSIKSKKFKLQKEKSQEPTDFEIEFHYKGKIYAYGIRLNGIVIEQEWLYLSGIDKEDKMVFEREQGKNGQSKIKLAEKYLKTQKDRLLIELMEERLLKSNELFLGKSEDLKIDAIKNAKEWITHHLIVFYPQGKFRELIPTIASSEKFAMFANELLETFDTGLKNLRIEMIDFDSFFGQDEEGLKKQLLENLEETPSMLFPFEEETVLLTKENGKNVVKRVVAIHRDSTNEDVKFNLSEESDGTQRLLDFLPAFEGILNSDSTFIIDEIDQSLHPQLLYTLVKKIMDDKTTKGQLIFTTHESNLLDLNIFRQDEIWFVEKNKLGATQLYSLSDFKPRYDLDIRKGYLKGRFGATPFTTDLKKLNWQRANA